MTSRSVSIVSNILSEPYYQKMEQFNDLPNNMIVDPIDYSQLSYNNKNGGEGNLVSKTADPNNAKKQQCVYNEDPAMRIAFNSNEHMYNM